MKQQFFPFRLPKRLARVPAALYLPMNAVPMRLARVPAALNLPMDAAPYFLLFLLLAGCATSTIDEGKKIGEAAGSEELEQPPTVPVVKSERVAGDTDRAVENYQKLLDLPQDPASRAETMRRLADLQLEQDETGTSSFEQSEQRLRKSIALYNTLLTENPAAPGNDRVLYQMSRAYQNLGDYAKAEEALARLVRDYPQSAYSDDAHFRRAELLFRLNQFEPASAEYQRVLNANRDSPFFEPAQYKFGWSQYKISNYEKALDTFIAILDRELPPGELTNPQTALDGVRAGKKDTAKDALRVASLSLAAMGGGEAANKYFAAKSEPPYAPLLYSAMADHLLDKKRYTDAAKTYVAYIDSHPTHALAPVYQSRAIAAQADGGFAELVVKEKERYAAAYDPAAPYWTGRVPTPEVLKELRTHLEDLARHYQAKAQKGRDADAAPGASAGGNNSFSMTPAATAAKADFKTASARYKRLLEVYPQDPKAAELRFLMAESYYDGGETLTAAKEYETVAANKSYAKAPEAAYAAVLAYQRYSIEVPAAPGASAGGNNASSMTRSRTEQQDVTGTPAAAQKTAAIKQSVQSSLKLADSFPQHPKAHIVLTRAAEELYALQSWDEAIAVATRVVKANPPATEDLRRTAWGVTADAQFSQKRYAQSEAAYVELLKLTAPEAAGRNDLNERLASAIYKQGEGARAAKDLRGAASAFLRVGQAVPGASIRAASTYDAAAMLIVLKDWNQAGVVLEGFRTTFPTNPLVSDVDDKLAVVYQNAGKLTEAAAVQKRIASRSGIGTDARSDAAWQALTLLDQAKAPQLVSEYESYLKQYPQPLDRAMEARNRLSELAAARGDNTKHLYWQRDIITADAAAGSARTPRSKQLAAQAALEFGRIDAAKVGKIQLRLPLKTSLASKKEAVERAITTLSQAADYGIADATTAATYELGVLYQEFSQSLLASERPKKLSALEQEQYGLLLEEQAFPFEEKAIQFHDANLQRVTQGVQNEWVGKSLQALAQLAPGKYGKREQTAEIYDALH